MRALPPNQLEIGALVALRFGLHLDDGRFPLRTFLCIAVLSAFASVAIAASRQADTAPKVPVVLPGAGHVAYPAGVKAIPPVVGQCMGCHGPNGISQIPEWPNIAGQKKDYLLAQLKAFKSGTRVDDLGMMPPVLATLSDQDMQQAVDYFSAQPRAAWTAPKDVSKSVADTAATCQACHNNTTSTGPFPAPILDGQKQPYLHTQLTAFRDGTRKNAEMSPVAAGLTDVQITQIVAYLSQQPTSAAKTN